MKVSVIITTYNRAKVLEDMSLPSAINQHKFFHDFEIIVVDDCSTDNTADVVKKFIHAYYNIPITYVRHDKNQQVAAARNTGLKHARGEFIIFLDDDDALVENACLLGALVLDQSKQHNVVIGQRIVIYPEGLKLIVHPSNLSAALYLPMDSGFVIRKAVFDKIKYDEDVYNEDADFGIQYKKAFGHQTIMLMHNPFLFKSGHSVVGTGSMCAPSKFVCDRMEKYLQKNLPHYYAHGDPQELEYIFAMAGRLNMLTGNVKRGRQYLLKAFRAKPQFRSNWKLFCFSLLGQRVFTRLYGQYAARERYLI